MRAVLVLLSLVLAGCASVQTDGDPILDVEAPVDPCVSVASLAAPTGIAAVPGPGPGMATVTWQPVDGAARYVIYRDGEPVLLGNTLAFGDHGSRSYKVAAIDACGLEGPASAAVTSLALPGAEALKVGVTPLGRADGSQTRAYPVLDADGNVTGNATWRIVTGTGNCCENYVITTPTGRIVDFGGTFLHYSDDEGLTWSTVGAITPYLNGEGALVTGPQGDIAAVGWDPYTGDRLWAHKYVAADDQWYTQVMPLHQPFYDRAWTTILKGPFEIAGRVAPYIVLVESNFHGSSATVLLRSLDALHYAEVTDAALPTLREPSSGMPLLGADPDMDWMHPISQSPSRPLAPGFGLQQGSPTSLPGSTPCTWRLVHEDGSHSCPGVPLADLPRHQPLLVDGAGNIHHFLVESKQFTYRMMPLDGDWVEQTFVLPEGATMRAHDQKVNAVLDTAVFAMHVNLPEGRTGDYLYRFVNITTTPVLQEIKQVGAADTGSDSGLGGDRRFDFMTVGMLPDGRAVLSFTDDEFHPPALAIEQPAQQSPP